MATAFEAFAPRKGWRFVPREGFAATSRQGVDVGDRREVVVTSRQIPDDVCEFLIPCCSRLTRCRLTRRSASIRGRLRHESGTRTSKLRYTSSDSVRAQRDLLARLSAVAARDDWVRGDARLEVAAGPRVFDVRCVEGSATAWPWVGSADQIVDAVENWSARRQVGSLA
jgi:hypothetical protein